MTEIRGQKSEISKATALGAMVFALCFMLLAPCSSAQAQQAKKIPRLGYLSPVDPASESPVPRQFGRLCARRGYIEGQNIAIEYRYTEGKRDRFPELAKEAVPKIARVAVLYDPAVPGQSREVKEDIPVAARALGLTVRSWEVRDADGFERVFAALNKRRPDGIYLAGAGGLMRANRKRIAGLALKSRIPAMYGNRDAVEAGGLMYYGADQTESYRRIAYYVDRILKGAKPTDLPVEQPTKFELVINLRTAKQIGLTIPQSVLYRADKVIR
jgi:ABC transporter substrate binding protein